jgi:hypothetical protein
VTRTTTLDFRSSHTGDRELPTPNRRVTTTDSVHVRVIRRHRRAKSVDPDAESVYLY